MNSGQSSPWDSNIEAEVQTALWAYSHVFSSCPAADTVLLLFPFLRILHFGGDKLWNWQSCWMHQAFRLWSISTAVNPASRSYSWYAMFSQFLNHLRLGTACAKAATEFHIVHLKMWVNSQTYHTILMFCTSTERWHQIQHRRSWPSSNDIALFWICAWQSSLRIKWIIQSSYSH